MQIIEKKEIRKDKIIWERKRADNGYVLFHREYKAGCPFMLPIEDFPNREPEGAVYHRYLDSPVSIRTGLVIDLEESGFFEARLNSLPIFHPEEFLVTENGAYPRKESCSDYHTKIGHAEPHVWRVDSELIEEAYYHAKYYCDGRLYREENFPLDAIFSANRRVRDKRILSLFSLAEENLDVLKKYIKVKVSQGENGIFFTYANGEEREAVPCSCSGKGLNDTLSDITIFRDKFFCDGENIFIVCTTCGDYEKII